MTCCPSCGGIIGRECFNPQECAWITQQMAIDSAVRQAEYEQHCREHSREMERQHDFYLQQEYERHLSEVHGFDPVYLGM